MKFQFNIKMENDLTSVFFLASILKQWRACATIDMQLINMINKAI